ncbi:hypothetical protein [Parapedobacter sp. 2B3]|uniref:hypothetical protein n=1 Tax=Parapedobacter sp. 2B3 TaxID=3342381 RepID=UPI0035B605FA
MVGKTVKVIAFEIETAKKELSRAQRLRRIEALTKSSLVGLSRFTFDRDEANDYDG